MIITTTVHWFQAITYSLSTKVKFALAECGSVDLFRSGSLLIGWLINLPRLAYVLCLTLSVNHVTFVTNEL